MSGSDSNTIQEVSTELSINIERLENEYIRCCKDYVYKSEQLDWVICDELKEACRAFFNGKTDVNDPGSIREGSNGGHPGQHFGIYIVTVSGKSDEKTLPNLVLDFCLQEDADYTEYERNDSHTLEKTLRFLQMYLGKANFRGNNSLRSSVYRERIFTMLKHAASFAVQGGPIVGAGSHMPSRVFDQTFYGYNPSSETSKDVDIGRKEYTLKTGNLSSQGHDDFKRFPLADKDALKYSSGLCAVEGESVEVVESQDDGDGFKISVSIKKIRAHKFRGKECCRIFIGSSLLPIKDTQLFLLLPEMCFTADKISWGTLVRRFAHLLCTHNAVSEETKIQRVEMNIARPNASSLYGYLNV